jgi:hypothetical protein
MYQFSVPPPATPQKEQYIRTLWREETRISCICVLRPGPRLLRFANHRKHRWAILLALLRSRSILASILAILAFWYLAFWYFGTFGIVLGGKRDVDCSISPITAVPRREVISTAQPGCRFGLWLNTCSVAVPL